MAAAVAVGASVREAAALASLAAGHAVSKPGAEPTTVGELMASLHQLEGVARVDPGDSPTGP